MMVLLPKVLYANPWRYAKSPRTSLFPSNCLPGAISRGRSCSGAVCCCGCSFGTAGCARVASRRVAVAGVALMCCLLPSTVWIALLAQRMQAAANMTATAVAAGVIDPDAVHGETVLAEIVDALPVLKAAGTSIFTWPETRYLDGARMAAVPVAIANVAVTPVRNLLNDGSAMRFDFIAQTSASRMVLMCDNAPVGILTRLGWGAKWVGWSARAVAPSCLRAFRLSGSAWF
ncbi:putative membrane protein [Xanthomonas bromi]|uniref:Putative membrane protein n=1 Tax=Xanthomonas bromi TaxID=56449 RepID=A0A1C3NH05_9XANT|nr:putative membrane protein [Xanthomonas bromi]